MEEDPRQSQDDGPAFLGKRLSSDSSLMGLMEATWPLSSPGQDPMFPVGPSPIHENSVSSSHNSDSNPFLRHVLDQNYPRLPVGPDLSSQNSISSSVLLDNYPGSLKYLPELSTSQVGNALAGSQSESIGSQTSTLTASSQEESSSMSFVKQELVTATESRLDVPSQNGTISSASSSRVHRYLQYHGKMMERKSLPAVAPESIFPGEDMKGKIGFQLDIPVIDGKDWVYDGQKKSLYVKAGSPWNICFRFVRTPPPAGSFIRARAVLISQGVYGDTVPEKCPKLIEMHSNDTGFLWTDYKNAIMQKGGIIFPLISKIHSKQFATRFFIKCNNSCYGLKTRIKLIFDVLHDNNTLATASIEVRSCANPERDSKPKASADKKRKSDFENGNVVKPSKFGMFGGVISNNEAEIRLWLETVCNTRVLTERTFIEAGIMSLDEIFELKQERFLELVGELKGEVSIKIWYKLKSKERPKASAGFRH